jgi:hypothetical protein
MSGGDPHTVLEQYEALRREAIETTPGGPRGHGLALVLTRGLPGWLAALTALTPATAEPGVGRLRFMSASCPARCAD